MYTLDLDSLSVVSFSMESAQLDGEESKTTTLWVTVNICYPVATYLLDCKEGEENQNA